MQPSTRRHLLGLTALTLIVVGAGLAWTYGLDDSRYSGPAGICLKAGTTLAVIWLALPQLIQVFSRTPPVLAAAVVVSLLIIIVRPRTAIVLLPLLLVLGLLQVLGWFTKPKAK